MSQQPEPLSPEERAFWRKRAGLTGETLMAQVVSRLLAERDSLSARVSSLEAHAQEVRRAWDAMNEAGDRLYTITGGGRAEAEQEYSDLFDEARAAIDALVPPVPAAPPENEKEARPVRTEANAPDVRLPCCGFKMGWCRCNS